MKKTWKNTVSLIAALVALVFIFQNCATNLDDEEASKAEDLTKNSLDFRCLNESIVYSPLSKKIQINTGDSLYCELDLSFNPDLVLHTKNVDTGIYDRDLPYNVEELKNNGWFEGKMKSGKQGLLFRWRPDGLGISRLTTIVYASKTDDTVIDSVELTLLPPKTLNLGCKIKEVTSAVSRTVNVRPGQTLYCEVSKYENLRSYRQDLINGQYDNLTPIPISQYNWVPANKLNGEAGYTFEMVAPATTTTTKVRSFMFLALGDGNILSESVDITYLP